jgi:hypothetical protein
LHAKLVAMRIGSYWSTLLGSPNATAPAMLSTINIELAWVSDAIVKTLPDGLLPPAAPISLATLQFEKSQFITRKRWNVIESAKFVLKDNSCGRLELVWKDNHGPHDTKTTLCGEILERFVDVDMRGISDWFLETVPLRAAHRYEPGVVPIEMPPDGVTLVENDPKDLSPDDWLTRLAGSIIYPVHVMTRKSFGLMTRKLSETESQRSAQLRGTVSRRNPRVASANWAQVA